jgi:hypothetical protein
MSHTLGQSRDIAGQDDCPTVPPLYRVGHGTPSDGSGTDLEADDGGQDLRLRLEHQAAGRNELEAALDVVELAAAQVHPRALPAFAARLGRAYSRAMARLRVEQRRAVRAAVGGHS